ncbi:MAG: BatA and WFA domain-containing protein, partial [Planctomycetota bacterium]|nr:BatA and WFA domain-containing protein [Planctomycetota bacterium]
MHFIDPIGLLGFAALAPVIALYFLKLKREERVVPSTLLWKKVIEDMHVNAPFQRLRYSLLLLLQLLMIGLLGFALARPFLAVSGTEAQRIILLIDTSASMGTRDAGPNGTQTRLEAALQDARKKVDDLGNNGEMRIVAFDEKVRQMTRFTQDRNFLKDALDQVKLRD